MAGREDISALWDGLLERLGPGPLVFDRMRELKGPPGLQGSGRAVWQLGRNHVVKVAMNEKGLAQSRNEVDRAAGCSMFNRPVAWTESRGAVLFPLAKPLGCVEFAALLRDLVENGMPEGLEEMRRVRADDPGALLSSELKNPANWGYVDGELKFLDFGMDIGVSERYYPGLNGPIVNKGRTAAQLAADGVSRSPWPTANVKETT